MANPRRFATPLLSLVIAAPIIAQAPQPVAQGWTGWAQCQITIQGPGYSHGETHVWKVAGEPTRQGNMEISPMTWTVTGNGSLQRVSGPTTVSAQWTVNGTLQNVTSGATLHLDRITIHRWTNHGPARSALTGTEVTTTNGAARSRVVVLDVQQWAFPGVETGTTGTRATGSNTVPFDGLRGPMNPPSGAIGTAACTWDFARGGVSPSAPPSATTTSTTPSSGAPVSGGGGSGSGGATAGGTVGAGGTGASGSGTGADLSVAISVRADPPVTAWPANGLASYQVDVRNNGPLPADGAIVRVPLSPGFGFVIPTFPAGDYVDCVIAAAVTGTTGSNATVTVSVTASGAVSDPSPGNNSATNTLPIR
jgi:hypothetical protein